MGSQVTARHARAATMVVLLPLALSLGGCAQGGVGALAGLGPASQDADKIAAGDQLPLSELQKAASYWGKAFGKNPRDPKAALNYARNLKAMGEKRRALAVLQRSSLFNGNSIALISEYGRLALELGQVGLAEKLLARADNPARPDWRVISARGTAYAKQGRHKEAISFFERASALVPSKPSVMNNLAMGYAMDGRPEKAEGLLRKAALIDGPQAARIRQNLSLVLGLQGKYDEAKTIAARQQGNAKAQANIDTIRKIVKLEPKLSPEAAAEAEAAKIIAAAKAADKAGTANTKKTAKRRLALRRTKIEPAATPNAAAPAKLAQAAGPLVLRPSK